MWHKRAIQRNNSLHTSCALFCKWRSDITERTEETTYYTLRVPCNVSEDLTQVSDPKKQLTTHSVCLVWKQRSDINWATRRNNLLDTSCALLCKRGSDLSEWHEECSKLFLRVAQLCQIFAYRKKHTLCVVNYFFESVAYVRSSLTEQDTRSVK